MPQIMRQDGVPFVVYTYREIVTAKKTSLLKRELQLLARENGDFARFYVFPEGDYEVIFSRDSGYLLAENIWQHFGNPADLLYCEQMADTDNALLVVVRDSNVYLDAELPIENITDELVNLVGPDNQYKIYVYGDIPLSETETAGKFSFDDSMVKSFTILENPVFPTLETDEALKLIPFHDALAELPKESTGTLKIIIVVLFLAGVGYGIFTTLNRLHAPIAALPVFKPAPPPVKNPYADYFSALETPAPAALIVQIMTNIQQLLTIPGWTPISMMYDSKTQMATFRLKSIGGDTGLLLTWIQQNNSILSVEAGKASIVYHLTAPNRPAPKNIYNLRSTVSTLYDGLKEIFPGDDIRLEKVEDHQVYKSVSIGITFNDVSIGVMRLFADELQNFPAVLSDFTLNTIDHGILSGNIELEVLGAPV